MKEAFLSIDSRGVAEFEIKKSRFIGIAERMSTEEDFKDFMDRSMKEYPQARHYCSAWIFENGINKRYDDAGEPHGTAGMPILNVLEGNELSDIACIVIRYFGGVLLGTGGLVSAYGKAAKKAVAAAGIIKRTPMREISLNMNYEHWGSLEYKLQTDKIEILNIDYEQNVDVSFLILEEDIKKWTDIIGEMTSGQNIAKIKDIHWRSLKI